MDIRAVDLNLLKAFDALQAERAVTRAASRIGLSQPAIEPCALSRLRDLFSDDLFVRTPGGMEPTARAREIAPLVSSAIEQIEAALNLGAGFDPATSAATFTAGMAEYAEVALVGRLAEARSRARRAARDPAPSVAARRRCRRAAGTRRDRCRGRAPAHHAADDRDDAFVPRPVCRGGAPRPPDRADRTHGRGLCEPRPCAGEPARPDHRRARLAPRRLRPAPPRRIPARWRPTSPSPPRSPART